MERKTRRVGLVTVIGPREGNGEGKWKWKRGNSRALDNDTVIAKRIKREIVLKYSIR